MAVPLRAVTTPRRVATRRTTAFTLSHETIAWLEQRALIRGARRGEEPNRSATLEEILVWLRYLAELPPPSGDGGDSASG